MGGGEKCAARDNPHVACPVAQPPHANVRIQPKAQQQTAHPRQQKVLSDLAAAFHEVRGCLFVCVCACSRVRMLLLLLLLLLPVGHQRAIGDRLPFHLGHYGLFFSWRRSAANQSA